MLQWVSASVLVACATLIPQPAGAQTPSASRFGARAAEIVERYGSGGRVSREAFANLVNDTLFLKYDTNEDGALNVDEYAGIRLRNLSRDCADPPRVEESFAAERGDAGGPVDARALLKNNAVWKRHVESSAGAGWELATRGGTATSLDTEALEAYLAAEHARTLRIRSAAERLAALMTLSGPDRQITSEVARRFYFQEWFQRTDANNSGSVDWLELTAAVDYPTKIQEFCALNSEGVLVGPLDLTTLRKRASELYTILDIAAETEWRQLNPGGTPAADVERIRRVFDGREAAALDELRKATLGERGFVPDFGWLLTPARIVRDDEITWNRNKRAVFLRVVKDFTIDDPTGAEAALFSVSKEAGEEAVLTVDSTVQLDIYPMSRKFLRGAMGVDVARITGGGNETDTQTFYGFADLFFWHGGVLEYTGLTFSPFLERDRSADVSRFAGLILWQPGLRMGRFMTNAWRPLGKSAQWFVTPRMAFEFGENVETGDSDPEEETTHVRLELLAGATIGRFSQFNYKLFRRFPVGNNLDQTMFQEVAAAWKLDQYDRFSVKANYARGEKTVTGAPKKIFTVGIGIKF